MLEHRRLYLCTPDRPDLERFVGGCIDGGADIVQLRDKVLDAKSLVERARLVQRLCTDEGVPFFLNDRPDLALDVGADGVHVGQDDAAPELARRILGPDALIGLSTHAKADLDGALLAPVNYISAGPVVPTPTKPGRPGTGTEYLRLATARSPVPVFVTGGVTPDTVGALVEAGARHFVVVRWLTEAETPKSAARALRRVIDTALETVAHVGGDSGPDV